MATFGSNLNCPALPRNKKNRIEFFFHLFHIFWKFVIFFGTPMVQKENPRTFFLSKKSKNVYINCFYRNLKFLRLKKWIKGNSQNCNKKITNFQKYWKKNTIQESCTKKVQFFTRSRKSHFFLTHTVFF